MFHRARLFIGLTAVLCAASGCFKDKSKIEGGDAASMVGTWLEQKGSDEGGGSRRADVPATKTNNIREITLNADGTFKMVMLTPDKKPIAGAEVTGQWKPLNTGITFTVDSNKLDAALHDLAPARGTGVFKGLQPDQCNITDLSSLPSRFVRKG